MGVASGHVLRRVLSGTADAAIRFEELCHLLESLGFEKRVKGSHHVFRKAAIACKRLACGWLRLGREFDGGVGAEGRESYLGASVYRGGVEGGLRAGERRDDRGLVGLGGPEGGVVGGGAVGVVEEVD